jgi:L-amino acid N-acyltransferase YncA
VTLIRQATPEDAEAICDIWNAVIRDTLITFTTDAKTPDAMTRDIKRHGSAFLVAAATDGHLQGFACYGAFRSGPGYEFTREHTVMLASSARGQGTGRLLMEALEQVAQSEDVMSLIAGISGKNPGGIAFHSSLGFDVVGCVPKAGFKSGEWIDLVLMQKIIGVPH